MKSCFQTRVYIRNLLVTVTFFSCIHWICGIDVLSYISGNVNKANELTLFTALNRFDPDNAIFKQAIQSWQNYSKFVVIFVDRADDCIKLKRFHVSSNVKCAEHQCMNDELKIPTVSCLLLSAEHLTTTNLLMFTNSDIIFSSSLRSTMNILSENIHMFDKFIAVGRRTDVSVGAPFPRDLIAYAKKNGVLHSDHGIDYFIFLKGSLPLVKMPPFVIGNIKWDNWLLSELLIRNLSNVVDVTNSLFAVHVGLTKKYVRDRPGFLYNEELWKISRFGSKYIGLGSIAYAGFCTEKKRLVRQNNPHANMVRMLYSNVHRSGFLFILSVSAEQLKLLENWLCWADRANLKRVLVFAMDSNARDYVRRRGLTYYYPREDRVEYPVMSYDFESISMDARRFVRAKFLFITLRAGISFVALQPATLVLSDPPLKVSSAGDVLTYKTAVGTASSGADLISDSFFGITSTEEGACSISSLLFLLLLLHHLLRLLFHFLIYLLPSSLNRSRGALSS